MYNAKVKNIKDKMSDASNVATETNLNVKVNEVKGVISSYNNLATTTALTGAEVKLPNISNLVKRTDYKTNVHEI